MPSGIMIAPAQNSTICSRAALAAAQRRGAAAAARLRRRGAGRRRRPSGSRWPARAGRAGRRGSVVGAVMSGHTFRRSGRPESRPWGQEPDGAEGQSAQAAYEEAGERRRRGGRRRAAARGTTAAAAGRGRRHAGRGATASSRPRRVGDRDGGSTGAVSTGVAVPLPAGVAATGRPTGVSPPSSVVSVVGSSVGGRDRRGAIACEVSTPA